MAFQKMRVAHREIKDPEELNRVLANNIICRIAFWDEDEGYPYIVPIDYGYEYDMESGKLTIYCHCALAGRKIELIKKNNKVAFEIDSSYGVHQTELACEWGMNYDSITGVGRIYIVPSEELEEKRHGLDVIMRCHGRTEGLDYAEMPFKATCVLRLEAENFTGKRYRDRTKSGGNH